MAPKANTFMDWQLFMILREFYISLTLTFPIYDTFLSYPQFDPENHTTSHVYYFRKTTVRGFLHRFPERMTLLMHEKHEILNLIHAAKKNSQAADAFIQRYMGFIRSETAKFIHRIPQDGLDDELSIAMFAFYESILGYENSRGSFLAYAAQAIKNRLFDHYTKEKRHWGAVSLDEPVSDDSDSVTLLDRLEDENNQVEAYHDRMASRQEIREFSKKLLEFGISFSDVADNCPKQERTMTACYTVLAYAKTHTEILTNLENTGKLPISQLSKKTGVEKKTLERHRKYLVAILLAYTNGYEIIRGHLCRISPARKDGE